MDKIFEVFSTREVALLLWVFLIAILCFLSKGTRASFLSLLKLIFTSSTILIIFVLTLDYVLLAVDFLQRIKFWNVSLIKDTVFWTIGTGVVLVFNSVNTKEAFRFNKVLIDVMKWTILLEFIVNFYTFSLIIEIILLPSITFIIMTQVYSEYYTQYKKVESLFKTINGAIGLSILSYATYRAFNQPEILLTIVNLKIFVLPLILTLLFLPFVYCLALYSNYESLFIRLPFLIDDDAYRKSVRKQILLVANFSLSKLLKISGGIAKLILVEKSQSLYDIKKISK
ncbi:MAG: hypothetical protein R2791_15070 [Saprospiraceae bacterium]